MESNIEKAATAIRYYLAECECGEIGNEKRKDVPATECKAQVSERLGINPISVNWSRACQIAKVGIKRRDNRYWWFFKV